MTSTHASLLDRVSKRYGVRPSQILQLDEWTGFQLDAALATKFDVEDKDFLLDVIHDLIIPAIDNVVRASGAKMKQRPKRKKLIDQLRGTPKFDPNYIPTVEEVLSSLGNKAGTIIKR